MVSSYISCLTRQTLVTFIIGYSTCNEGRNALQLLLFYFFHKKQYCHRHCLFHDMQEEKLHARLIALCMACIFRIISSTADCFKRILNNIRTKGKHSNAARESSKMTSFLVFHNNSVANISFPAVGLMIFTFLLVVFLSVYVDRMNESMLTAWRADLCLEEETCDIPNLI